MPAEDFTIDKVGWHTRRPGNTEPPERVIRRFVILVRFLEEHQLVRAPLIQDEAEIDDEFAIKASALTDVGLEFIRKAYQKWIEKIDHGLDPRDTTILARALQKLKGSTS